VTDAGDDPAPVPDPDAPPGPVARAVGFVIAVLGIVLVAITPNPPATAQHWIQIVGGAALSASIVAYAGWWEIRDLSLPDFLGWLARRRVSVGVGVVLTAVLAVGVPPGWELVRGGTFRLLGCPPPTQLRMVANPETVTTAHQLAGAYERWTAAENHDCPTVDVYVYAGTSDEIRERARTADGWSDESGALGEIGPRSDVWLAATSHELAGLDPAIAKPAPVRHRP
jgi:hypothetical protein